MRGLNTARAYQADEASEEVCVARDAVFRRSGDGWLWIVFAALSGALAWAVSEVLVTTVAP